MYVPFFSVNYWFCSSFLDKWSFLLMNYCTILGQSMYSFLELNCDFFDSVELNCVSSIAHVSFLTKSVMADHLILFTS